MKENIFISLKSIQVQDDEKSESELITRAKITKEGKKYTISYKDTKATGFDGCVTTIDVDGSKFASIIREGWSSSVLSLEVGKKHFCSYETPFGSLQIGIYTHAIENKIAKEGTLYMKYTLDLNSSYLSDNEIFMKIQENIKI